MNVEHWIHRLSRLAGEDTNKRFDRLYREIAKPEFLWFAYDQIKGNRGSRTPGADGQTASDWTIGKVESLSAALRDGNYQPQPVRRVYIPKKSGKLRPLGIPAFEDRVVQSAVKIVLEALYEPIFLDCSHGFRPGKGCPHGIARRTGLSECSDGLGGRRRHQGLLRSCVAPYSAEASAQADTGRPPPEADRQLPESGILRPRHVEPDERRDSTGRHYLADTGQHLPS